MTLADIKTLLVAADAKIQHYFCVKDDGDYSYWEETRRLGLTANDGHEEGWQFYAHRFTRDDADTVATAIYRALDADPRVTVIHTVDFERETGYIHHIFECEGY